MSSDEEARLRTENAELKDERDGAIRIGFEVEAKLRTENASLRAELAECTKVQCVQHIAELTAQLAEALMVESQERPGPESAA